MDRCVALSEPSVIDGEPMVETLQAMIAAVEKVVVSFKGCSISLRL